MALLSETDAVYPTPAEGFAEIASTYDVRRAGNPLLLLESTAVLTLLPDLVGKKVVDFGCGTGRYALQCARLGAEEVVGIDLSPEMLHEANRKTKRAGDDLPVSWRTGNLLARLPAEDREFDVGVCALVASFLPSLPKALQEMARVLPPNGTLIVSDYHPQGLFAARATVIAAGRPDTAAPYLRFTAASGEEWRIAQTPHSHSDWLLAARGAGLALETMTEPLTDRRLATTYPLLRDQVGIPLALVMRFRKES